jgi:glycine betaine/proline transport system substrate-binding protein
MTFLRKLMMITVILALAGTMAFAEGSQESGGDGESMESKGRVELAYVEWARAVAITHVTGEILDRMGYNVRLNNVANAAMWQAVASGDADAHMTAWLPATHGMFYGPDGEFTDQIEDLGVIYEGAGLGLVAPQYVEEDSIEELVANRDKYDGEIVGIDPGAGMMQQLEQAIEDDVLGLGSMTLLEGSGPTMTAALSDAIENERPVVVTGWRPHWKFARWDLKILDQSSEVFGGAENIHLMVRQDLSEDKPEVYKFFAETDWQSLSVGSVMADIADGMTPEDAAAKFVDNNVDTINGILPSGMSL